MISKRYNVTIEALTSRLIKIEESIKRTKKGWNSKDYSFFIKELKIEKKEAENITFFINKNNKKDSCYKELEYISFIAEKYLTTVPENGLIELTKSEYCRLFLKNYI